MGCKTEKNQMFVYVACSKKIVTFRIWLRKFDFVFDRCTSWKCIQFRVKNKIKLPVAQKTLMSTSSTSRAALY